MRRKSYLPNPAQELLLRAILWDDERAQSCWRAWRDSVAIDELDFGSQRLLPLLNERLKEWQIEHADSGRFEGVAKHTWMENQLLALHAKTALEMLKDRGIPAMLLKGLAVTPLYYGNFRLRAMGDFDILVQPSDAALATRILIADGWKSKHAHLMHDPAFLLTRHAVFFTKRTIELDLHWHTLHECCRPDADEHNWRYSQPMNFNGYETRTLSDTDHLFHSCSHGGRPNEVPPIRWVTDAAMILRENNVDWQRLLEKAERLRLVLRMQQTLGYLAERMELPVPAWLIEKLERMEPHALERVEERMANSGVHPFFKLAAFRYIHYRRNIARQNEDEGFLRYLQLSLGTNSMLGTARWLVHRFEEKWPA